jgi:hypothetical protein
MRQKVKHAVIKEQDVTFAIVQVKDNVTSSEASAAKLIGLLSPWYKCPVVLMGEQSAMLSGRGDLVQFIASLDAGQIPWQEEIVDYGLA